MRNSIIRALPARSSGLGAGLALGLLALLTEPTLAAPITLTESGSTLLYPLFNVWASEYAKTHPGVTIKTAATGSGAGIDQAISGAVQIGTSNSYMSDADIRRHPLILNIPMAISAQTVNYNLPGLNGANLKLDGPTLAGIYTGKIRTWDDGAIAALNAGIILPHNDIVPVRRAEDAGDTFIFTQYLTFSTKSWENNYGYGDKVAWPTVPGELEAAGNDGMVDKIKQNSLFRRLGRHQFLRGHRQGRGRHGSPQELFRRIPVADARDDRGGGRIARPADAVRRAPHLGQRAGPKLLSPDQLRIRDRLDQAGGCGNCRGDPQISAVGHSARRN